ncbi:MAG: AAA family ATPase [Deltaproteobacteria bacterium]|jgi:superfamily I DNA/RNA helicase|nr:AAA family ATPase [Deltaproteobacteria bacterium]
MPNSSKFKLTGEQQAIIDADEDLMAITAYAGTGKTFTLRAFAENHPRERMLYLAYNKAMAEESKRAFANCPNVEVRTIHSLAYGQVGHKYSAKLGDIRPFNLLPFVRPVKNSSQDDQYFLAKEILLCLNDFFVSRSPSLEAFLKENKRKIKIKLSGPKQRPKDMTKLVEKVWGESRDGKFTMPHNGYLKLFQMDPGKSLDRYDRILVDEAQDLNDCMIDLVINSRPKKIFVGDPYQQIYGFNGAVNALSKKDLNGAARYFLTQSFRCPLPTAAIANQYLTLLGAPKPFTGVANPPEGQGAPGNLVIARTNAGLFDFVAKNLPDKLFHYNGGFDGYQFYTILDLVYLINKQANRIKDTFIKQFASLEEIENYAEKVNDSVCLTRIKIAKRYKNDAFQIYDQMTRTMAEEPRADYIATTAHKIKGREYKNVILLEDFAKLTDIVGQGHKVKEIRDKTGSLPTDFKCRVNLEEIRLLYMAITRSKNELTLLPAYHLSDDLIDDFHALAAEGCIEVID